MKAMSNKETPRERLERLVKEMRELADACDAKNETTADDQQKLDDLGKDVTQLVQQIKDQAATAGTLDLAKAFLGDLAKPPGPEDDEDDAQDVRVRKSGIVNPKGMTLGEAFTKSPAYEGFVKQFAGSDGIRNVRGIKSMEFEAKHFSGFGAKTLVTGASATSAGAATVNFRYQPITDLIGERELSVRDLCTNISISTDTFEFVQVTAKTNNAATVAEATTSDDPAVYLDPASGAKPESALTLAVVTAAVETIAHLVPITRRAAADAPQVRALVDAFLLQGLREEEEDQILNGNGTSPNIRGILQTVGISTVGSAGTDLDAIVDAIRTVRADRRRPNAMVIHPNDWYSTGFLLSKDSTGRYLIGDPNASIDAQQSLWGLRVVVTEAMTENTALVGDFRQYVVADRQQAAIYVTDSHKDWFGRNILAVLGEERIAGGCLDPDAFCSVTAV